MMHPWCTMMHRTEKIWKDDRKIRCGERWRELSTPRQISAIQRFRELWISFFSKFLEFPSNSLHFLVAVMVAMWILRCEVKRTIAARRLKDAKARSDKISACPWAAHVSSMCHPCVIHVQRIESYRVHDPCRWRELLIWRRFGAILWWRYSVKDFSSKAEESINRLTEDRKDSLFEINSEGVFLIFSGSISKEKRCIWLIHIDPLKKCSAFLSKYFWISPSKAVSECILSWLVNAL